MAWFSDFTRRHIVDLEPEEIAPEPEAYLLTGINIEKTRDNLDCGLAAARGRLAAIEYEERRLQAEAANTRTAIAAYEAAARVLADTPTATVASLHGGDQP